MEVDKVRMMRLPRGKRRDSKTVRRLNKSPAIARAVATDDSECQWHLCHNHKHNGNHNGMEHAVLGCTVCTHGLTVLKFLEETGHAVMLPCGSWVRVMLAYPCAVRRDEGLSCRRHGMHMGVGGPCNPHQVNRGNTHRAADIVGHHRNLRAEFLGLFRAVTVIADNGECGQHFVLRRRRPVSVSGSPAPRAAHSDSDSFDNFSRHHQ